jgi:hypothetical protein
VIYIDDLIVKSNDMDSQLANLRLPLERMHRYGLKMNLLKCVFGVLTRFGSMGTKSTGPRREEQWGLP